MATNRPMTRRRSVKQAFEDDDVPAPKRPKTEASGASRRGNSTTAKTAKASKAAYEESDDGFQFSRRTSRRTAKAQVAPPPESALEEKAVKVARTVDAMPASQRKRVPIPVTQIESVETKTRRRSARLSGDREHLEVRPKATEPATSKRTKKGASIEKEWKKQTTPAPEPEFERTRTFKGTQTPTQNELQIAKKRDPNAQRIMLPFADTPVITRNKEMRKGGKDSHRRSSTGLRGRRASSLIDSGMSNALPHSEVEIRDFYKYIEQGLPEPRRMKQLLTWCGARALPEKPAGDVKDTNAIMAARAIQQELIDDFANKPELSDWFSREETASFPLIRKPNPQNEKNKTTLQELEEEVKRLEEEKAAWETLASTSKSVFAPSQSSKTALLPKLSDIDISLLDPAQSTILSSIQLSPPEIQSQSPSSLQRSHPNFAITSSTALQERLTLLSESLENSIDLFADGVHKIQQYRQTAERVADRILDTANRRLEERDRTAKEKVGSEGIGVGDVLRGLASVLGEQ